MVPFNFFQRFEIALISCASLIVCLKLLYSGEVALFAIQLKIMCRALLCGYCIFGVLLCLKGGSTRVSQVGFILFILNLLAIASLSYSVDRVNSSIALIEYFTSSVAAITLGYRYNFDLRNLTRIAKFQTFTLALIFAWYYVYSPMDLIQSMGTSGIGDVIYGFGGNVIHVHSLAMFALVAAICVAVSNLKRGWRVSLCVFFLLLMLATLSRTAMIAAIAAGISYFATRSSRSLLLIAIAPLVTLAVSTVIFLVYQDIIFELFSRGASIDDLLSGSNRSYIFLAVLEEVRASPLLGFGFDNLSSDGEAIMVSNSFMRSSPHNAFLYIFSSLGVIGLALFVLMLLAAYLALVQRFSPLFVNCYFIILLTFCLTQDSIFNDSTPLQFFTFYLLGSVIVKGDNFRRLNPGLLASDKKVENFSN